MMDEIHVERWDWLIKIFDFQDFKHTNIYLTEIVRQANLLLEQLNAGSSLGCVEDINAAVYVTLFEGLCGEKLHGKTTRIKMVESVGEVRWIRYSLSTHIDIVMCMYCILNQIWHILYS